VFTKKTIKSKIKVNKLIDGEIKARLK